MPKLFHQGSPHYLDIMYTTKNNFCLKVTIRHLIINAHICIMSFTEDIQHTNVIKIFQVNSQAGCFPLFSASTSLEIKTLMSNHNNYAILQKFCSHIGSPSLSTLSCIIYSFSITYFISFRKVICIFIKISPKVQSNSRKQIFLSHICSLCCL